MWNYIFFALTVTGSVLCLIACISVARHADRARESVLKRLRSVESRTELLQVSADEMLQTTTELANRIKMQTVRRAANHAAGSSGEPDCATDPDRWRAWMNQKIARQKFGL